MVKPEITDADIDATIRGAVNKIKLVILGVILMLILNPFYHVAIGNKGVVFNSMTKQYRSIEPGWNIKLPFIEDVYQTSTRVQMGTLDDIEGATADQQDVYLDLAIYYKIDPDHVIDLYKELGPKYRELLDPLVTSAAKAATPHFKSYDFKDRNNITAAILSEVKNKISFNYIEVVSIALPNYDFSDDYNTIIENAANAERQLQVEQQNILIKQKVAQQIIAEAEGTARQKTITAEAEANATLTKARAEAEGLRLMNDAIKSSPKIVALEMVKRWDGKYPTTVVGSNTVPILNINDLMTQDSTTD